MAKCDVCGKSVQFGNNVSKANNRTKKISKPNIKRVKAVVKGANKKIYACTTCIKSGKIQKPVKRNYKPEVAA